MYTTAMTMTCIHEYILNFLRVHVDVTRIKQSLMIIILHGTSYYICGIMKHERWKK